MYTFFLRFCFYSSYECFAWISVHHVRKNSLTYIQYKTVLSGNRLFWMIRMLSHMSVGHGFEIIRRCLETYFLWYRVIKRNDFFLAFFPPCVFFFKYCWRQFLFIYLFIFILYTIFCLRVCLGTRPHYRWLWATMWLLGIELRTSGRAGTALNLWAISPAPAPLCF